MLVIALLIMGLLLVVASSFMRLNLSEDQIATSDRDMILALNAAEAGVHQGIQNIKIAKGAGNLTSLLGNQNTGASSGGSYTFRIDNDPAEFPSTTDANGFLKITSTGRVRNAARIIETVLYVPTGPPFPAAIHVPGNEVDSRFADQPNGQPGFIVDGIDTLPPRDQDPPTSWSRSGVLTNNKLGVSAVSASLQNAIYTAMNNAERTTPVFAGLAGNTATPSLSLGVNTSLDSNTVQQYANLWTTYALPGNILNLPSSGQGSASYSGSAYSNGCQGGPNATGARASQAWGCSSNPGVFYIKGITQAQYNANNNIQSGDVQISGTFQGAGILIVDGADLTVTDNFQWKGIIIVTGPLVGIHIGGSANIFGSVVVNEQASDKCANRSDCRELILTETAAVRYSQAAINTAFGALAPRYAYWNERSQ